MRTELSPIVLTEVSRIIPESLVRLLVQKKTVTPDDAEAALTTTVRELANAFPVQATALFLPGKATHRLRLQCVSFSTLASNGDESRQSLFSERAGQLEQLSMPFSRPIAGKAMAGRTMLHIPDARQLEDFYDPIEFAPDFVIRSLLAVPIAAGDTVVACLEALNRVSSEGEVVPFSERDQQIYQEIARYCGRLIERALNPGFQLTDVEQCLSLGRLASCPFMEVDLRQLDLELLQSVGDKTIKRYQILPLKSLTPGTLRVALANPQDYDSISNFEIVTGMKLTEKVVATSKSIDQAIRGVFPDISDFDQVTDSIVKEFGALPAGEVMLTEEEDENSAPIIALANRIIEDAFSSRASDIHLEPQANNLIVRYRIDGVCRVKRSLPKQIHRGLITRLKIMSDLDIAERRLPQDGRIIFKKFSPGYDVDLRISVAPMNHGESVVMRLLDKTKSHLPLNGLGFSDYNIAIYRKLIQAPYGMILHTGPTGSGKSMTLFAALNEINSPELKILTVEDPIEYTLNGINQLQVKKDIGLTFASSLRCFLRQDPDVILVGEIRDVETAEIAIEAALTGHVIFSTLHTNDAPSTVSRLAEMGVEPFLISSTLVCVCSQRLVRRLCNCKRETSATPEEMELLKNEKARTPPSTIFQAGACEKCEQSGYRGRIGVHELLAINDPLRRAISKGATTEELRAIGRQNGMRTLFEDSLEKVKAGITSLPEALAAAAVTES